MRPKWTTPLSDHRRKLKPCGRCLLWFIRQQILTELSQAVCTRGFKSHCLNYFAASILREPFFFLIESSFCSCISGGPLMLPALSCLWADDSFTSYLSVLFRLSSSPLPSLSWDPSLSCSTSPGDCESVGNCGEFAPCWQPCLLGEKPHPRLLTEGTTAFSTPYSVSSTWSPRCLLSRFAPSAASLLGPLPRLTACMWVLLGGLPLDFSFDSAALLGDPVHTLVLSYHLSDTDSQVLYLSSRILS